MSGRIRLASACNANGFLFHFQCPILCEIKVGFHAQSQLQNTVKWRIIKRVIQMRLKIPLAWNDTLPNTEPNLLFLLPKQTANIRTKLMNRFEFIPKHVNNNGALSLCQLITGLSFQITHDYYDYLYNFVCFDWTQFTARH